MNFLTLACSYKNGGFCVAGIDLSDYKLVRLCPNDGNAMSSPLMGDDLILDIGRSLKIKDVISVDVVKREVIGCQNENYSITSDLKFIRTIEERHEIENIYRNVIKKDAIFLDTNYVLKNSCDYSLLWCKVSNFSTMVDYYFDQFSQKKCKLLCNFNYHDNRYNYIRVTDCIFRDYPTYVNQKIVNNEEAYVLFSLPEDDWAKNNGYYKYASGIILSSALN